VLDPANVRFRRLRVADLSLMHRWLNTGFVMQWYGKRQRTREEIARKYAPRIEGREPTDPYLILYGQTPIGYIQTYVIDHYPDYSRVVQVESGAAGVDLFIGEAGYIHKGLGAPALVKFLREVVFAGTGITCCVVDPEPANRAAIRAYEKAGFHHLKTVQVQGAPEYLMRVERADVMTPTR
jgi:aminoglycoside 6'-N-acetyltransferase